MSIQTDNQYNTLETETDILRENEVLLNDKQDIQEDDTKSVSCSSEIEEDEIDYSVWNNSMDKPLSIELSSEIFDTNDFPALGLQKRSVSLPTGTSMGLSVSTTNTTTHEKSKSAQLTKEFHEFNSLNLRTKLEKMKMVERETVHTTSRHNHEHSSTEEDKTKTKMCRRIIAKGYCANPNCTFAHTCNELTPINCTYGQRCRFKAKTCLFIHPQESKIQFLQRHGYMKFTAHENSKQLVPKQELQDSLSIANSLANSPSQSNASSPTRKSISSESRQSPVVVDDNLRHKDLFKPSSSPASTKVRSMHATREECEDANHQEYNSDDDVPPEIELSTRVVTEHMATIKCSSKKRTLELVSKCLEKGINHIQIHMV